jgi:hypothetical protein
MHPSIASLVLSNERSKKETNLFALHDSRRSLPAFSSSISDILPSCLVGLPRQNLNFRIPLVLQYLFNSWLSLFGDCQFFSSSLWEFGWEVATVICAGR